MTTPPGLSGDGGARFLGELEQAGAGVGVVSPEATLVAERGFSPRRRAMHDEKDPVGTILLTETDGVLGWADSYSRGSDARRAGFGRRSPVVGRIVEQFKFERLPASQVGQFLGDLDASLTPAPGLKRWRDGQPLQPVTAPSAGAQRILLVVHGTFSRGEVLIGELQRSAAGKDLLGRASRLYDEVLVFDHPTLSVGPLLNAVDLARLFQGATAAVDVLAHSRGGLVARWWLDVLRPAGAPAARAVLVGSPLSGTSLASPARLRAALNLLTNVARGMALAGAAASITIPLLTAVVGVMKILASITAAAAHTPLVDAGIALFPGLAAQSAVSNNAEIARLRAAGTSGSAYFAVLGNFESADPGWAFWKRFRKSALLDAGADLIFEGANDLVVDTASMTELAPAAAITTVLDYGTSDSVHHTNYFSQSRTAEFVAQSLSIP